VNIVSLISALKGLELLGSGTESGGFWESVGF